MLILNYLKNIYKYLADNGSFLIQARHIGYIAVLSVNDAKSMLRSRNFNTNESLTSYLGSIFFNRLCASISSLKSNRMMKIYDDLLK